MIRWAKMDSRALLSIFSHCAFPDRSETVVATISLGILRMKNMTCLLRKGKRATCIYYERNQKQMKRIVPPGMLIIQLSAMGNRDTVTLSDCYRQAEKLSIGPGKPGMLEKSK